jgi:hypothetical protein
MESSFKRESQVFPQMKREERALGLAHLHIRLLTD